MHTDYVVWYLPLISYPPPTPSLMYRLMWALWGVAMTYSMWLAYICRPCRVLRLWDAYVLYSLWSIYGVYMGYIWENRVTEDSAGGGPCVRRAPPPALPCRTVYKILPQNTKTKQTVTLQQP